MKNEELIKKLAKLEIGKAFYIKDLHIHVIADSVYAANTRDIPCLSCCLNKHFNERNRRMCSLFKACNSKDRADHESVIFIKK